MVDVPVSSMPVSASDRARGLAILSVLTAMAAAVLDASSVTIALPAVAQALQRPPAQVLWLMIAYQAALVAGLLPIAVLGERFGARRIFRTGTGLFMISALACLLVSDLTGLIVLRVLQGFGAAAIMALGVALLRQAVAPDELGKAIGWNAMTVALASAAGPTIGATLLSFGGWQFVFIGGPTLACISFLAAPMLPRASDSSRALDGPAMMLYLLIAPTITIAFGLAGSMPWLSAALAPIGLAGVLFLVRRDRHAKSPFLPLDLLRNIAMRRSVLASIACFTGQSLGQIILPFALHARIGASALEIAMYLTPWPVAVLLTTPITTRLLDRHGVAQLCAVGGTVLSLGLVTLALLAPAAGAWAFLAGIALCGVGFGMFQTPNNRSMFLAVPVDRAASAGGIQGTARLTGQASGGLLATFLLTLLPIGTVGCIGFLVAALATMAAALISVGGKGR